MRNTFFILSLAIIFSLPAIKTWSQKTRNDSLFKEVKMPVDESTKLITYSNVINIDCKKDSLYKKGLKWFNTYYKNSKGVIKSQNPVDGKIVGKPQFRILNVPDKNGNSTMMGIVYYTITTMYKDGKCRYEITDINLEQASKYPVEKWLDKSSRTYSTTFNYYLKQIDDYMKVTVKSYEDFMKASTTPKSDAW